jgi:carbamoyltransferase
MGIHKDPWHDTGAAIIKHENGVSEAFSVSEERLDRKKDSRSFPNGAIKACLSHFGLTSLDEIDVFAFDYIKSKNLTEDHISGKEVDNLSLMNFPEAKVEVFNHHLCHAASVFYSSGFKESAILIVDGRGSDDETQSLFIGDESGLRLIENTKAIGIGLLYTAVTRAIGFGPLQEGKTMGLAPFGSSEKEQILNINGVFNGIETNYENCVSDGEHRLRNLRVPLETFEQQAQAAYQVQQECEKAMLHLAKHAKEITGMNKLCISGGVALNSVANYKILNSKLFDDVFINPAASDTGIPLGAAMAAAYTSKKLSRLREPLTPFLGPSYKPIDYQNAIAQFSGFTIVEIDAVERAVDILVNNGIVANHYGRSEIGPRALGNRSILMSPLKAENKDTLNLRVKHRESFRPFAPVTLDEYVSSYFVMDRPCPYMLFVPQVREEKRKVIPAVTHVDGSGRLQSINAKENPLFAEIVEKFGVRTGVPVVLNTSFNDNGEPIVESPVDAIRSFLSTNIDALLLNGKILLIKD